MTLFLTNTGSPEWYPKPFLKQVLRGIPNNIAQILRQTYDKHGTCFPLIDHDEIILGVNVRDCWSNIISLTVKSAVHTYGPRALDPKTSKPILTSNDLETSKFTNPQPIADKLCSLNML